MFIVIKVSTMFWIKLLTIESIADLEADTEVPPEEHMSANMSPLD
jgi:hypothetical protein